MTFSKITRTLVGSTALAAAFSMPLMAQEAPETSPAPEAPTTQVAPEATPEVPAEIASTTKEAIENGTAVAVTSDDAVIGKIETVTALEDGTNRYEIALGDTYDVEGGRVAIQSTDQLNSEGQLELEVTEQEFAAAVQQQLGSGAGTGTETQTN
ncbi:hypothetical protein A8B82_09435 [Sulfitobacter sp. EhC04]|uniref:hypothetical protein n=1 Tax=Sulfitobacter sp. EhC04 TaxID=1849168 RepID=UPI0007F3634E|nr:hypothetical protein [Sulfitobacter sp. EhC04]OAN78583.1 hypothetical protein A8B82_09435 [Sulfitobacter sp. EhC04]